jgi:hypothetical protein
MPPAFFLPQNFSFKKLLDNSDKMSDSGDMKTHCRSYKPYEQLEPEFFKGDKECSWFAPGVYEGVTLACTKPRAKYLGRRCPWGGRPDKPQLDGFSS